MHSFKSSNVEDGVNGIIRRLSHIVPPASSRIVQSRSRSLTHVSSKYESLDYDVWVNDLLVKEEQSKSYHQIIEINIIRWFLYFLVGLMTGLIAVFIDLCTKYLRGVQISNLVDLMNNCSNDQCYSSYIFWFASFVVATLIGTLIVVFIEPRAAGSGIPYIISYLNGVSIPKITTLKVLIIKIVGVVFVGVAGLAAGKEGPFIHIGSIVGGIMTSLITRIKIPTLFDKLSQLNTNQEKRDLMAAGCAAGVSAAFGSPVGATLLSLEEGTSFWSVVLMWRIFFCSIISTFTFNTAVSLLHNSSGLNNLTSFSANNARNATRTKEIYIHNQLTYQGLFYFGKFKEQVVDYSYLEFPLFFLIGVIGGLLGALFVYLTSKITILRLKFVHTRVAQVVDSVAVALLTAAFSLLAVNMIKDCSNFTSEEDPQFVLNISCSEGNYNEMSAFWLQSQEVVLRLLFHSPFGTFDTKVVSVYLVLYFVFLTITAGIKMPVGIFIPSLLVGATWGRLFGLTVLQIFPNFSRTIPEKYALIGAAAMLGGVMRTTVSLTVIVIEASGALVFGFPLMFTLFITKWVGDFFTEGVYESQIYILGLPILSQDPPPLVNDITAKDLMNRKVIAVPNIVSVRYLLDILSRVRHQGFPVVKETSELLGQNREFSSFGELRGFILRSQLVTLLITKSFNPPESSEDFRKMLTLFRNYEYSTISVQDLKLTEEEKLLSVDLRPYMNPSPYSVQMAMSFPRIFRLLRSLGLRHVIVVNNSNQVVGMITRKDLAKYRIWRHATSMGLKELRIRSSFSEVLPYKGKRRLGTSSRVETNCNNSRRI